MIWWMLLRWELRSWVISAHVNVAVDGSVRRTSEYVNLQIFHTIISFRDERLFEFRMLDESVYRPGQNHPRA